MTCVIPIRHIDKLQKVNRCLCSIDASLENTSGYAYFSSGPITHQSTLTKCRLSSVFMFNPLQNSTYHSVKTHKCHTILMIHLVALSLISSLKYNI